MTMITFDPAIQTSRDGPLTPAFRQRILDVKAKCACSYADIAVPSRIGASTLANIVREVRNTTTATANRLRDYIRHIEMACDASGDIETKRDEAMTVARAKKELALTFGVPVTAIDITIRWVGEDRAAPKAQSLDDPPTHTVVRFAGRS
jgi:hypothetical protein